MAPRIGIIGVGGIGGVVGGMMTRGGHDVTLIDGWPEHVDVMKRDGLRVTEPGSEHLVEVNALHVNELQSVDEPFDYGFVAVKSYDTEWATALIDEYVKPEGAIVVFQNGINDERVAAIAGAERTLGCVITIAAAMYEPGHVTRTDTNAVGFKIGEQDGRDTPRARELAEIVNSVAPAQVTTNLWGERWAKLASNCMANPIAGLTGLGSAELRADPEARRVSIHVAAETISVARALGHEVEPLFGIDAQRFVDAAAGKNVEELETDMAASAQTLAGGRPSFLQDVMKGRRTEIDYLNGYVSERGREVGVPTPVTDAVVETVHNPPGGVLKPDRANLAPLTALIS
jgi:2-dehydropantoate 2-reductase